MKHNKTNRKRKLLKTAVSIRFSNDYHWKILDNLRLDLCHFLDEAENLKLQKLIRKRDLIALIDETEDWGLQCMNLNDVFELKLLAKYQLASLLKKFELTENSQAAKLTALEKFTKAEDSCDYFNSYGYNEVIMPKRDDLVNVFTYARSFISKVLGDITETDLTIWSRHGPGATVDTKNGNCCAFYKFQQWPYSCTTRAFGKAVQLIRNDERWLGALEEDYRKRFDISPSLILDQHSFWHNVIYKCDENKITFVPKSAKTFRTIAIEPTLNLYLQLGVDGHIRRRLKRWGTDLDDQSKNQKLAKLGSVNDAYATIDLSAASDTISIGICKLLLPPSWYDYLVDLRAPYGRIAGSDKKLSYKKVSSMGNGYTFALESLIFNSLVYGVSRELFGRYENDHVAIYGDDLIVPIYLYPLLVEALQSCGFKLNHDKSFTSGPVRESCGADYFRGILVRPVFLHKPPNDVKDLFNDYNRLKRILSLHYGIVGKSFTLSYLYGLIPPLFRKFIGPLSDEEFDTYLHSADPSGSHYSNGTWKYSRLIKVQKPISTGQLNLRKLMHPLRQQTGPLDLAHATSSGSNFVVAPRHAVRLGLSPSETSIWSSEYTTGLTTKKSY